MSRASAVAGVILLPGEDQTGNMVVVEPPIKRRRLSFSISGGSAVQEVGHVPGLIIDLEDDDDCTDLFDDFELSPKDEFQSPPSSPDRQEQEWAVTSVEVGAVIDPYTNTSALKKEHIEEERSENVFEVKSIAKKEEKGMFNIQYECIDLDEDPSEEEVFGEDLFVEEDEMQAEQKEKCVEEDEADEGGFKLDLQT